MTSFRPDQPFVDLLAKLESTWPKYKAQATVAESLATMCSQLFAMRTKRPELPRLRRLHQLAMLW